MTPGAMIHDAMHIEPPFREPLHRAGMTSVGAVLHCPGDSLAAWSRTSDTIRFDPPSADCSFFIKRYHYPRWKQRLRAMLRGTLFRASRARQEYRALKLMRQLGIQAVRPVAYGERRIAGFLKSCFLITEAVPDAMSLATFILKFAELGGAPEAVGFRREILTSLARQVRRMHAAGFMHRDLFWRNVLIRALPGDRFEFYFLDASVGRRIRIAPRRQDSIVRDLAALGAVAPRFCTKADQLRFLIEYLGVDALSPEDRAWLLRVQTRSDLLRDAELQRLTRGAVFAQGEFVAPTSA